MPPVSSSRCLLGALDYFCDCCRELIDACARDDNGVAAAMRFLGNAQEFAPIVLAELYVESFALNLKLSRLDDIIHFLEPASLVLRTDKMKEDFARIYAPSSLM
jgi:hypothetical protein